MTNGQQTIEAWRIDGAAGEPVLGDCHRPGGEPRGAVVIAHGFKGYKDYGMFPAIAETCAAAGLVAHRFNFSHSGMTNRIETFERPELFQLDTWNKQVTDVLAVLAAMAGGELAGGGLPVILFGHSRGGVAVLLAAGRTSGDESVTAPAGIVTAAAPSTCRSMSDEEAAMLLELGWLPSPSARTGQELRVGRQFLQEQIDDPSAHDLLALVGAIQCPILAIHGSEDPTVPPRAASEIAAAARKGETLIIQGANHVFNTPNPMPEGEPPSAELAALLEALVGFAGRVVG